MLLFVDSGAVAVLLYRAGAVGLQQQLEILGEVDDAHEKFTQTLEKQKDLIVRVAGYSAFFNVLSRKTQDDIIGRTEQSL